MFEWLAGASMKKNKGIKGDFQIPSLGNWTSFPSLKYL